jgi:hypothetical protein
MSLIVQILKETEVILPATIVEALHRERRERLARASRRDPRPGTAFANARDADMGQPEVRAVGRSPGSANPIRSVKSKIVPEPDQVQSERPKPRLLTGPFEPQG